MHRSWSEWDCGSGYNCRARIDVYWGRGVRNIFVLDIHYHNTHQHTTAADQTFTATNLSPLMTEFCEPNDAWNMGLHQINTSHASNSNYCRRRLAVQVLVWLVSGEGGWYLEASGGAGLSRLLAVETIAHRALGGDMGHTLPTSSCSM